MSTRKDDFVTITSIIKREIQKRKKQKKPKDELINCIPISNGSAEDETELILFKKKKKKKQRDKQMVQNDENMNNHIGTLKVDEFYDETCNDNDKHLYLDQTLESNVNKDELKRRISIANASEDDLLFKKKKKKKKRDKQMVQNDENMNNHIGTLKVDEFYNETCNDNDKHLYLDQTLESNVNNDELKRRISIANASEDELLFKKKKKKKKRDKQMVQNDENMNNHIGTLKVDEFYNETCNDNDKHLYLDQTLESNVNKDELKRRISIANASEDDLLFKKKKKKKKRDKQMVQNDENMNNHIGTLKVDEFYDETCNDNDKHLYLDQTLESNVNKDELKRRISIANASEDDLLFKKKKKKKKRDKQMVQNDENMNNHIGTLKVDEFYNETCNDNDKHLYLDQTLESNVNNDELKRRISIANASEDELLFKKKKKKKKRDKQMVQNDENMNNHIGTLKVDEFYNETCNDNDKHLYLDQTLESNVNKDELKRRISIANVSEDDLLFKRKKKKKKRDKQMVQNDENMNNHIGTLKVDEFYNETCDDNDKHLYLDQTLESNVNNDELKRRISIANASEDDLLFKKKKKKKKRDKQMVQNDENINNHIGTLKVDEFYNETCYDNDKHLYLDQTLESNVNKDELKRRISIANASEDDLLFKKKKKKKKRDKQMVQNDENMNNHIGTLKVDEFYNETCNDNDKHLYLDQTLESNVNKDELKRRISIANVSEDDLLFKKKKKKKKRDKQMVQNDENMNNHIGTLKVDEFYNETCYDNDKHLYLDQTLESNVNKDELKRRISIANASEDDLLFKKKKKKKKRDKQMVQKDKYFKNDKATLNVEQFYDNTCDDKVKYLNKINISASNLNKDNSTTSIQISNASEDDDELTLLKSPLKKSKLKKKKSKVKKEDTESSKYESIQKNFKNMEDLKNCISEEQSNEIHNDPAMIKTSYNSRISKIHEEEYPDLFQKLFKNKKNKKSIKAVPSKELVSPKKLKKRKRQTTDREYSKNDSLQSVDMDVETYYDRNNFIDDDGEKKLELFDSLDDHTSEYCTKTVSGIYFDQYYNQALNNSSSIPGKENFFSGIGVFTPLQCDVCFKTFNCKSKLYIHKRMHTGEKPYACNVCGRSFSKQHNLVVHIRTHTGEKPYACNVCGNSFSLKGNLVTHTRTHTGEKPHACNVCGQSFSTQQNLVTHTRTHTGEKPYACDVCGRSFAQQSTFVVHYRIHTGERPYECGQCEKKFKASSERTKHTRRVHIKCF